MARLQSDDPEAAPWRNAITRAGNTHRGGIVISNDPPPTLEAVREAHRALVVLRALFDPVSNGHASEAVLSDWLDTLALGGTRDSVRTALRFLERSGLITLTTVDDCIVAHLTREGGEVADGRVRFTGVLAFDVRCVY